jgi:hypothetical protein
MLPPYIIEELRRREEALREERARPQPTLELPIPMPRRDRPSRPPERAPGSERGVEIIDVM